jgi:hypothetical protein
MNKHLDTMGWESKYEERKMAACEFGREGFPAAHNCPIYKYDEELSQ